MINSTIGKSWEQQWACHTALHKIQMLIQAIETRRAQTADAWKAMLYEGNDICPGTYKLQRPATRLHTFLRVVVNS